MAQQVHRVGSKSVFSMFGENHCSSSPLSNWSVTRSHLFKQQNNLCRSFFAALRAATRQLSDCRRRRRRGRSLPSRLLSHRSSTMKLFVLLVGLVIGRTSCVRLRRMVGARDIEITAVPYQVSIRFDNYHICGGTLISSEHVLTAAHCVADLFDEPYDDLTVVTGTSSLKSGGETHGVKAVTWHDEFINGLESYWINDIAVLTLSPRVRQNGKQKAIHLPTKNAPPNVTGIISGFGRTDAENYYPSTNLKGTTTRILPSAGCRGLLKNHKIRDTQICGVQPKGIGICKGDSGGPLVFNGTIVGVASWNQPCALGIPDVYTNVYDYLDFIKKIVKG